MIKFISAIGLAILAGLTVMFPMLGLGIIAAFLVFIIAYGEVDSE